MPLWGLTRLGPGAVGNRNGAGKSESRISKSEISNPEFLQEETETTERGGCSILQSLCSLCYLL
jgi:hypothetical protein